MLSIGGWHDGYRNTVAHLVENVTAPVKGIVGPWIHKYPHYAAPQPAIGFLQEAKRWWDHWLKGQATGVESDPAMRLWLMDSVRPASWHKERPGRWIAEAHWPAPGIQPRQYWLTDFGLAMAQGPLDRLVSSPQDCGLAAGEYFPFMFGPELPTDQRADDALSACFDSVALRQPIDVVGAPRVSLTLSADRPQANVCVRLCDVHPDGASELIAYGLLNLTQRVSAETPAPLVPGETIEVTVVLDQCAYRVPAGHRLRIAVSTAYWPMIWPSPQAASLRLSGGALSLPARPTTTGDEWHFDDPQAATPWATETLRPAASSRHLERDLADGTVRLVVDNDFGAERDADHGLVNDSRMRESWSIRPDDPLSATAEIEWHQAGGRGDWRWSTMVRCTMRSTAEAFHLTARLDATEGDEPVSTRQWDASIPRRH